MPPTIKNSEKYRGAVVVVVTAMMNLEDAEQTDEQSGKDQYMWILALRRHCSLTRPFRRGSESTDGNTFPAFDPKYRR
jgi:hypothetical protein